MRGLDDSRETERGRDPLAERLAWLRKQRHQGFRIQVAAISPEPRSEFRTKRIIQGWTLPENGAARPVRIDAFQVWRSPRVSGWEGI